MEREDMNSKTQCWSLVDPSSCWVILSFHESVLIQPQLTQWIPHDVFRRPDSHVSRTVCALSALLHSTL